MSEHHHHHAASGKNLFITILLNIIITLSQIIGGLLSGSLALLSDALHNFSDVLALVIAYAANRLAARPGTESRTFGYKRAEILAALFNGSVLIGIAVFLIVESLHKLYHPEAVNSAWVIGLGLLSIFLNAASVLLVKGDAEESINIRAAYLHLLTDVMTSIAVVGGGLLMYYFHLFWVDPLISMLIALYLIRASLELLGESTAILMQFTPEALKVEEIARVIDTLPAVANIHHIHLWSLDDHEIFLEAHIDFRENLPLQEVTGVITAIETLLEERFGVTHTTLQAEYRRCDDKRLIAGTDPS